MDVDDKLTYMTDDIGVQGVNKFDVEVSNSNGVEGLIVDADNRLRCIFVFGNGAVVVDAKCNDCISKTSTMSCLGRSCIKLIY